MKHAPEFQLDLRRAERTGLDEAVLAAGKSLQQLEAILASVAARDGRILLTRLEPLIFESLSPSIRARLDYDAVSRTGWFGEVPLPTAPAGIAIVTAGTSDVPVAREAARTIRHAGEDCVEIVDVGVAGLWRLLDRMDEIRAMPVVIVVAGMDAALPTVIGAQVTGAVIAVPTSTGYGVAAGGMTALHAALASCAPGVTVVNIDNGYGAASAALRVVHALRRVREDSSCSIAR